MNLIKSTGTFSFFTLISRLSGYLRDILIAIFLGAGPIADAFFVAYRFPNTFRRLFSEGTFNAAFVPSYSSELNKSKKEFKGVYDENSCAEIFGQYLKGTAIDNVLELNQKEKERIFNLGYYTWVEQQGVSINDFEKRKDQKFWNDHFKNMISLDNQVIEFNNM